MGDPVDPIAPDAILRRQVLWNRVGGGYSGIVQKNAFSNTATMGISCPSTARPALIPDKHAGLCNGAGSLSCSISEVAPRI